MSFREGMYYHTSWSMLQVAKEAMPKQSINIGYEHSKDSTYPSGLAPHFQWQGSVVKFGYQVKANGDTAVQAKTAVTRPHWTIEKLCPRPHFLASVSHNPNSSDLPELHCRLVLDRYKERMDCLSALIAQLTAMSKIMSFVLANQYFHVSCGISLFPDAFPPSLAAKVSGQGFGKQDPMIRQDSLLCQGQGGCMGVVCCAGDTVRASLFGLYCTTQKDIFRERDAPIWHGRLELHYGEPEPWQGGAYC